MFQLAGFQPILSRGDEKMRIEEARKKILREKAEQDAVAQNSNLARTQNGCLCLVILYMYHPLVAFVVVKYSLYRANSGSESGTDTARFFINLAVFTGICTLLSSILILLFALPIALILLYYKRPVLAILCLLSWVVINYTYPTFMLF